MGIENTSHEAQILRDTTIFDVALSFAEMFSRFALGLGSTAIPQTRIIDTVEFVLNPPLPPSP